MQQKIFTEQTKRQRRKKKHSETYELIMEGLACTLFFIALGGFSFFLLMVAPR